MTGIGVYVSYPFCAQKCTYCNFASGVFAKGLDARYVAALEAEIRSCAWPHPPDTVYLGGGTPSSLKADALGRILDAIPGAPWPEATIEVAPGSLTRDAVLAWRAAGINRVSLGVQSFVEAELRRTGRKHTAESVARDVALIRGEGLGNFNIDLIAGLAGQTRESWAESLDWVARLEPPHVSVYMLEVDEDSRLGLEILNGGPRFGASEIPGEDLTAEFYETAVERLQALGIPRYEISNFARPGAESLHNLKYWRLQPYIGFGADAHSCVDGLRWQNVETAAGYVARYERGEPAREEESAAGGGEKFFVGLRLAEGVAPDESDWRRYGAAFHRFLDGGLLEAAEDRLRLTARGVLVSNEVFQEFLDA
ncbi:MAG: radical SAM family heme chaperone HemW [Bryobacterales bacterium]|nr:radical SAM family heme chaperone HemW [Bryobacterales bacterium]